MQSRHQRFARKSRVRRARQRRIPLTKHASRFACALALLTAWAWPATAAATIQAIPGTATVVQGGTSSPIQLTIAGANNPGQVPVNLVITGLPPGVTTLPSPVTATFNSTSTASASFRFDVAPGTAPGVYPVTIAGPGGFGIGSTMVTLTVPVPTVSVAPQTVSVQAGQTSPSLTVSVTNVTDQSLAFAPTLPAPLAGNTTVQPSPVVVTVPSGPTTGAAAFAVATTASTPPGTYQFPFLDPVSGLGFSITLQVTAAPLPPPSLTASPSMVSVGPGELGPPVTLTLSNAPAGSYAIAVSLPAALAGNTTAEPAVPTITVPAAGVTSSTVVRLRTTAATPPGTYTVGVANTGLGVAASITLQVPAAPVPTLTATPALVSVGPAELGPPVTLTLADAPAGSYAIAVSLPAALAGNTTAEPAVPTITVPAAGVSSSTVVRLRTSAASPPGTYTVGVANTGLGVAADFALSIQTVQGSASIVPGTVTLGPGQTSGPLTLRVSASNLGGQTLDFRPQGAPGLSVEPSPVRVQIPPGGAPASATFRVTATAAAAPGSLRLTLGESTFGLAAAMTVVVEAPRAAVSVTPARVTLAPGGESEIVTLRVADSNLAGRVLSFRLANPGNGLSLVPPLLTLTVPSGGAPVSGTLRVAASSATVPGVYPLEIAAAGLPELRTVLTAEVERPVVIERLDPRALAQGVVDARLRLIGEGFQPGARVVSASSLLAISGVRVLSPTLAEARVAVRRDAPVGAYALDLINPDGSRSSTPALVAVVDRGALTAPVGVETLAIVHPAPGAAVALDDAIYPRGLIATTGTGTLVGSWRLDGVPFDRFVVQARGGEPAPVSARLPIPRSALGRHLLELAVESPVELVSAPVELLQVVGRASQLRLHAPADGTVGRGSDLDFRWSAVPGAAGYQVEILRPEGAPPLLYRVPRAHWRPRERDLAAIGTGLRRWRVRPILAGGVEGEATEPQRFALLPDRIELALRPARRDAQSGELRLAWEDAGPGILYRVEVWGEPAEPAVPEADQPLFVALTAETSFSLPADADWAARARSWRLVALGPGGVVLGASARSPLPAGGSGAAAARGGRARGARSRSRVVLASQGPAAGRPAEPVALTPAAGSEVATAYPRIEASWEPAVAPDEVSLVLDGTDVTLVAAIGPSSLVYESLLPLAPGEHRVELWLGEAQTGWTFSVAESVAEPAAGVAAIPGAEEDAAAEQEAWLGDPVDAAGAADAGVAYDFGGEPGGAGGPTGGWADWRFGAEGTLTRLSGDDLDDESSGSALLSGQVDYQEGAEDAGGTFAKGTGDVGYTETFEGRSPDQESRSWVLGAGWRQRRTRQELAFGYASPDFLFGSELLADGLPQGGGQATAGLGPASLSYYRTFDPDFGGSLSGAFGPSLELQAGALTLGDESGRFQLRAVGLETEEDGDDFDPGGEGSVVGLFTSYALTPAISLIVEGARGEFTPVAGSFDEERSGNAFRLGATGTRGAVSWGVSLRFAENGFVNPAARNLTAGVIADRAGADVTLTRSFESGASLGIELRHLQGGTDSGLDSSDARQDGGIVRYSARLGEKVQLSLSGNYMSTRGGGDPELGLPDADLTDRGAQLSLTESWGRVSFSQSVTWQDSEDASDASRASEVINASLSANATFSQAFSLFGQLDGLRNETGGPFGSVTETLLASLQPTWTLTGVGLSFQPYAAYNRLESDFSPGATESESYRLLISWTPPKIGRYLGLQASADWNRTRMPGFPDPGLSARYTASITLRWDGSGQAGAAAASPEYALLPSAARHQREIRDRLAGLPGGMRLASWF